MNTTSKRKAILINKKFQYRMIAKFILLNIFIMIIFCGFLYLFLNSEIDTNLQTAHVTYKNIKDMLFPIIASLSVINILISSFIIGSFVLYASFKIAGPLFRFNEALKKMTNKNLKPVTEIREDDQLYDCSITLTDMSAVLSSDFSEIKKMTHEIKSLNKKGTAKGKLTKKIDELVEIIDQYHV